MERRCEGLSLGASEALYSDGLRKHVDLSTKRVRKQRNTLKNKMNVTTLLSLFSEPIRRLSLTFDFPLFRSRTIIKAAKTFYSYTEYKMTLHCDISKKEIKIY
jgi:hypothetical protein